MKDITDRRIICFTTKAKTKLSDDNILRGVGISVDTLGGYVTLAGAVENEKDR